MMMITRRGLASDLEKSRKTHVSLNNFAGEIESSILPPAPNDDHHPHPSKQALSTTISTAIGRGSSCVVPPPIAATSSPPLSPTAVDPATSETAAAIVDSNAAATTALSVRASISFLFFFLRFSPHERPTTNPTTSEWLYGTTPSTHSLARSVDWLFCRFPLVLAEAGQCQFFYQFHSILDHPTT